MKQNQSRWFILFAVLAILLGLSGCDSAGSDGGGTAVQTISWEQDGSGRIQFYTNEEEHLASGFWISVDTQQSPPLGTAEIQITKNSGAPGAGFGMMFDYLDSDNYSRVLLSQYGNFQVVSESGGTSSELKGWTSSGGTIKTAAGETNTVKVTIEGSNLKLFINGSQVFSDPSYSTHNGQSVGAYASVHSTDENFPEAPVDVRFKITQPTQYP